jgi:hypothetical protein
MTTKNDSYTSEIVYLDQFIDAEDEISLGYNGEEDKDLVDNNSPGMIQLFIIHTSIILNNNNKNNNNGTTGTISTNNKNNNNIIRTRTGASLRVLFLVHFSNL